MVSEFDGVESEEADVVEVHDGVLGDTYLVRATGDSPEEPDSGYGDAGDFDDGRRDTGKRGISPASVVLVIAAAVLFGLWYFGYVDRWLYLNALEGESPDKAAPASVVQVVTQETGTPSPYAYSQLDEADRAKYDIVYSCLTDREEHLYPSEDIEDLARIRECVMADHPELFSVTGVSLKTRTNGLSGIVEEVGISGSFAYSPEEEAALAESLS